ncbi:MAG: DUF2007 domain-containing protein [Maioricimonas sp. JB049]
MDADELVTIYSVNEPTKAELIKVALQGEGIACEISGENQAGMSGVLRVDVLVMAKDAERARKFIDEHEPHQP